MTDVVIFLDVDGVLGATVTRSAGELPEVQIPQTIVERVLQLRSFGEIIWATSWDAAVRDALTREIGLTPQPAASQ